MILRTSVLGLLLQYLFLFSAQGDTLLAVSAALDVDGVESSSSTFINVLSLDVEMPYGGDILVIANYNAQVPQGVRSKGSWRLESGGRFSTVNERYLVNTSDLGIGSIVFIGTNAGSGTIRINLQNSTDYKPIVTSRANMIALPLITSGSNLLDYGFFSTTSTSAISSTSFQDFSATTSVSVVLAESSVLIACSVNSSAPNGAETGEWKLQYKNHVDSTWLDASYTTKRYMGGTDDTGSIVLHALVEDLDVGEYDVRLVARSEGGSAVNLFNISLAAVNLAYANGFDGGSFFSVTAKSLGGETSSSTAVAVPGASIAFTPPAAGNLLSLSSFSGIPIGVKRQTCEYDIALTNSASVQTNQNSGRYFSDTADWGSGGSVALFTNLNTVSYVLAARHKTDSSSIGTSNVTLIGICTVSSVQDSDQDGMPDDYEYTYFGNPTNALATADQDEDGVDNLGEYLSRNDPTNSESVFAIDSILDTTEHNPSLEWISKQDRVYDIYWTSNLLDEFTMIYSNIVYPQNTFTDLVHSVEMTGFYRLKVRLP